MPNPEFDSLQTVVSTLADASYWVRRIEYLRQRTSDDQAAVQSLLDRLNQFRIEQGERSQPLGTTDLSGVSRGSGGSGGLGTSAMSTVGGVKPSHNSSSLGNRSPMRETDNGHRSRERYEKRVSEESDRAVAQHHNY